MKPIRISPSAAEDLLAIAEFLDGESGGPYLGDRFLAAAESNFHVLKRFPLAGRVRPVRNLLLAPLRSLAVDRPFQKYLAFYQPLSNETRILRVLHGAQDLIHLLDLDAERDA